MTARRLGPLLLLGAVLALVTAPVGAAPASPLTRSVTLQFVSIDAFVVLAELASAVGLTFVHEHADPAPRVTVDAVDQPAATVVDDVSRKTGLQVLVVGRALIAGSAGWLRKYRDVTTFSVTYTRIAPEQAATIVQNVFPWVVATVKGSTVTYGVPRAHLAKVQDIATTLEAPPPP